MVHSPDAFVYIQSLCGVALRARSSVFCESSVAWFEAFWVFDASSLDKYASNGWSDFEASGVPSTCLLIDFECKSDARHARCRAKCQGSAFKVHQTWDFRRVWCIKLGTSDADLWWTHHKSDLNRREFLFYSSARSISHSFHSTTKPLYWFILK